MNYESQKGAFWAINSFMFTFNPFYTFFMGNFSIIMSTLPDRDYVDILPDFTATPLVTTAFFIVQGVIFFLISVCIDSKRLNSFRKADNAEHKI